MDAPGPTYLGAMLRLHINHIPRLEGQRVVLRTLQEEDAPAVLELRSDPQVMRYIPKPLASGMTDVLQMIDEFRRDAKRGNGIMWAITIRGSDKLVGYVGFWRIDKHNLRGEIGYALHPDLWGQGLTTEAVALVLEHGFAQIGFHSVEAAVQPGNQASIRLLERNAFVREAHFKENVRVDGRFLDTLVYSKRAPST